MPNKDVVNFRRDKVRKVFFNFSAYDLEKVEFDRLQFISKDERSCYNVKIMKFNKKFYVYREEETDTDNYKEILENIDEVNGFIKALYKVFHCSIEIK